MNRAVARWPDAVWPKWNPYWLKRRFYAQRFLSIYYRGTIPAGPFAGMRYAERWWKRVPNPAAMLGTYEMELWPVIERVIARPPGLILNIGTAEGYYTAGLSMKCPETRIVGFERDATFDARQRALERMNGVIGRVQHRYACSHEDLNQVLSSGLTAFALVDVDGQESSLLDMTRVPALAFTEILVEVHDHRAPGTSERLIERFSATHQFQVIPSRRRVSSDLPPHPNWFERRMLKLAEERSLAHQWFHLKPQSG